MKTIFFLRHAKSSWKDAQLSDIDRPLNKRGKNDAPIMAKRLKKLKVKPDIIISSPAKRALTTADMIAAGIGYAEKHIRIEMNLYGSNTLELMDIIQGVPDKVKNLMLVGHNPGFNSIIQYLSNHSIDNLPTCAVARIDFRQKKWKNIEEGTGKLIFVESPKKLREKEKKVKKKAEE